MNVHYVYERVRIRYTSLRANLQHCADLGQEAFLEAEGRMKKLQLVAEIVNSPDGAVSVA